MFVTLRLWRHTWMILIQDACDVMLHSEYIRVYTIQTIYTCVCFAAYIIIYKLPTHSSRRANMKIQWWRTSFYSLCCLETWWWFSQFSFSYGFRNIKLTFCLICLVDLVCLHILILSINSFCAVNLQFALDKFVWSGDIKM